MSCSERARALQLTIVFVLEKKNLYKFDKNNVNNHSIL